MRLFIDTADEIITEIHSLVKIAPNIAVKVTQTKDGSKSCKPPSGKGDMINVTRCSSANQVLLAAKASTTIISQSIDRFGRGQPCWGGSDRRYPQDF